MNAMPDRAAFALRKAGPPTPLLSFLAGEHADTIARLWPAPHEAFFALPTARRHAAAIIVDRGFHGFGAFKDLPRWLACERDAVIAQCLVDGGAQGLMKALRKAGETLWPADDYRRFLTLFAEPNANRALRHMPALDPVGLRPLAALPEALRETKILSATPTVQAAEDLDRAFALIGRMNGKGAQRGAVEAWSRAQDRGALFNMAAESLAPQVFRVQEPVPALPAPFERVRTMDQLCRVALDFRNCLRDFAGDVANGRMAVFVWRGEPNAAVALTWDAAGWRLAEAEAADNTPLEDAPLRAIVGAVLEAGGRTGPALKVLIERLRRHIYDGAETIGPNFDEQLELGDLWP